MPVLIPDAPLDALLDAVKRLKREQRAHQRNAERSAALALDDRPSKRQRVRDALLDSSRMVDVAQHEVHVRAVEAGLAEPEPDRYRTEEYVDGTFGQRRLVTFREPALPQS